MNKIIDFHSDRISDRIHEQAALWIARLDRKLSSAEYQELQAWINASLKHRAALFEMASLWDRMAILNELSELFPLQRNPLSRWRALPIAAAALALGAAATGVWLVAHQNTVAPIGVAHRQPLLKASYETGVGEQRVITLPDGSVVTLNTRTRLQAIYTAADRKLMLLEGEAHFAVAKGDPRVFTVQAGENEFKAVGTAFNVRMDTQKKVELTVTEGRVKVLVATETSRPNAPSQETTQIMVDAGREVVIDNAIQTVENLPPAKLQAAIAWTQGMIVFDGEPLEQAIREVSRYSTVQWVLADDRLRQMPVSGYFKVGDVDGLLTALHTSFDIEAVSSDGKITLSAH